MYSINGVTKIISDIITKNLIIKASFDANITDLGTFNICLKLMYGPLFFVIGLLSILENQETQFNSLAINNPMQRFIITLQPFI